MRVGIVGSEAAKFTPETEARARVEICKLLMPPTQAVISGGCHLGGVDIWAKEEALAQGGIEVIEHLPKRLLWSGGYKDRNMDIATDSDYVVCITVAKYPDSYKGMRFSYCYHCGTADHVKSGGCWTVRYAAALGKTASVIVI